MSLPFLFGVKLPQISKIALKSEIKSLKNGGKTSLFFLYSEFLLRANRNPAYKQVLNKAGISAIDGKGLHWAMWRIMKIGILPSLYSKFVINWVFLVRMPIFLLFFGLELLINLFSGLLSLLLKINFTDRTKNQTILGRDLVYDLLKIAEEKNWKTLILGGNSTSDQVTKNLITRLFPKIDLITWTRDSTSLLMKDTLHGNKFESDRQNNYSSNLNSNFDARVSRNSLKNQANTILKSILFKISNNQPALNSANVCQAFPDLYEAKLFIKNEQPDLILTCLGGASGKQEFFIDNLCSDPEIKFTLATGIGAAVDHLGGGAKQKEAPKLLQAIGLEWLFRFYSQPYRRIRIIDSVFTLWFWTTLQEFMQEGKARQTVHAAVCKSTSMESQLKINTNSPFLLVERYNILPGDVSWSMVQGEVEAGEKINKAALREVAEETNLPLSELVAIDGPVEVGFEYSTISFLRYIIWGAKFNKTKNYVQLVQYIGQDLNPETNWENKRAKWWPVSNVSSILSEEKRISWDKFIWQKNKES